MASGPAATCHSFLGMRKAVGWLALVLASFEAQAAQLSQAVLAHPSIMPGCSDPRTSPAGCWQGNVLWETGTWATFLYQHPNPQQFLYPELQDLRYWLVELMELLLL